MVRVEGTARWLKKSVEGTARRRRPAAAVTVTVLLVCSKYTLRCCLRYCTHAGAGRRDAGQRAVPGAASHVAHRAHRRWHRRLRRTAWRRRVMGARGVARRRASGAAAAGGAAGGVLAPDRQPGAARGLLLRAHLGRGLLAEGDGQLLNAVRPRVPIVGAYLQLNGVLARVPAAQTRGGGGGNCGGLHRPSTHLIGRLSGSSRASGVDGGR